MTQTLARDGRCSPGTRVRAALESDPRLLPAVVERNGAPAMDPNELGGEVCADARKGQRRWAKKM